MKLLILTDQIAQGGGAGVVAWNHAQTSSAHGFEVVVVTTTENIEEVGEKIQDRIKIITLHSKYNLLWRAYRSLNNPAVIKELKKILEKEKPDIVHAHNIHLHISYQALVEARRYTKKIYLTVHDSMPFHYSKLFPETVDVDDCEVKSYKVDPWKQFKLFKWQFNPFRNSRIKTYLKIPTKIFAVSDALRQALNDNDIYNVEVIRNGIDTEKWKVEDRSKQTDKKYIVFCGRLSAAKGARVLIKALAEVVQTQPDATLLVIGTEDTYAKKMKEQARDLGVETNLEFTGWTSRDKIKYEFARGSMVVVPSLCFDWFPTVVLEGMATRKPVITSCFGGSKEAVIDGKTGFVINPQDPHKLAEKILYFLNNPGKIVEFGNNGFERVKKDFPPVVYNYEL